MGFFTFFSNQKQKGNETISEAIQSSVKEVTGLIGYYGLSDWWFSEFTEDEQNYINQKYQPLSFGSKGNNLISGDIKNTSGNLLKFLWGLAGWFKEEEEILIAERIFLKAESSKFSAPILDQHFLYGTQIEIYYRRRSSERYMNLAIEACYKQIAIAPQALKEFIKESKNLGDKNIFIPSHQGYRQLAIILEKQKQYKDVIDLCIQAQSQAWSGDWENRIERCQKKMNK